jgi:hypothetical protein
MTTDAPWNEGIRGEATLRLINSDDRVIRVEAGPGTGKTIGLVRRVQRIVHPNGLNVPGREVLVVAFNRIIAAKLREDIDERLKTLPEEAQPTIRTVHRLCLDVVGTPVRLLLEHERDAMMYDVLHANPALVTRYKNHDKADQALKDHEAHMGDHVELWQDVGKWLLRHKARLVSELPTMLLDKIKTGDYTGGLYEHVVVDEYQDLTPAEQLLFNKLRRPGKSLTALGDSKQSIYKFRGNEPEGLRKLEELDPTTPVTDVPLNQCYRCPPKIVQAANRLMSSHPAMEAANTAVANIHVVHWDSYAKEARGMAKHIVDKIHATRTAKPPQRHLAMVTRKQFGYALRDEIRKLDDTITVNVNFSESMLDKWPVREAFLFFCLLADNDPPTWRAWLGYQNPKGPKPTPLASKRNSDAYLKFLARNNDTITPEVVTAAANGPASAIKGTGGSIVWSRAKRYVDLVRAFGLATPDNAGQVVKLIFHANKWTNGTEPAAASAFTLIAARAFASLDSLTEAHPSWDAAKLLREVARRLRHLIATREPFESVEEHDVQIMTLWGAKGVTAEHVYVLGLCNAALPGQPKPEYPGTDLEFAEEQRRLFYVTLTRARETLVLSRFRRIRVGDARDLGLRPLPKVRGYIAELEASTYLRDILPLLPDSVSGPTWGGCCG